MLLYSQLQYAESLSQIGKAFHVPAWGTSVLLRKINETEIDATGVYPIAAIRPNANFEDGLAYLREHKLISIVLVVDDFHRPALKSMQKQCDLFKKFKTHYLYRPELGKLEYDRHHRYEIKKAFKNVQVKKLALKNFLPEWKDLYQNLIQKQSLKGIHLFNDEHFSLLSEAQGVDTFSAWIENELVSCHIWVQNNGFAHSHLAASSTLGYQTSAAYAVNAAAIEHYANFKVVNFGGGAGFNDSLHDGLSKFKRGFSNAVASAHLLGIILNHEKYDKLVNEKQVRVDNTLEYFPAYRA